MAWLYLEPCPLASRAGRILFWLIFCDHGAYHSLSNISWLAPSISTHLMLMVRGCPVRQHHFAFAITSYQRTLRRTKHKRASCLKRRCVRHAPARCISLTLRSTITTCRIVATAFEQTSLRVAARDAVDGSIGNASGRTYQTAARGGMSTRRRRGTWAAG